MILCKKIKEKYPYIPTFLLLNNPGDVPFVKKQKSLGIPFDNYFVWTGESKVFFAMVKLLEDKVNVDNDTKKGLTRVILIVEDSAEYYSSYLPMLYTLVMEQTKNLIEDVSTDELYKVLKLGQGQKYFWLPIMKIPYQFIISIRIVCYVLSPTCVSRRTENYHDTAGFELIKHIKEELPNLPSVLQSSDPGNASYAHSPEIKFHKQKFRKPASGSKIIYKLLSGIWPFCIQG